MPKYDQQLGSVKEQLANAQNVLVALPSQLSVDILAAGLALFLSLRNASKNVSIVSSGTPLVSQANLFGLGDVKNTLPEGVGGNLTLTLEDVVDEPTGTVPSLDKLDWFPEGKNLNLVFHVLPGQKFEPTAITPKFEGASADLIFVVGVANLTDLGNLYQSNQAFFPQNAIINIDNKANNSQFGVTNLVDNMQSTISQMIPEVLNSLGLQLDPDSASNILAGVYTTTNNLTTNVTPDSFMAVATAMQYGGQVSSSVTAPLAQPAPIESVPAPQPQMFQQPVNQPISQLVMQQPIPQPAQSGTTNPFLAQPANFSFAQPQTNLSQNPFLQPQTNPQPIQPAQVDSQVSPPPVEKPTSVETESAEQHVVTGEVQAEEPEVEPAPDWLAPKVFKGSSIN